MKTSLYRHFDADGALLYVGIAVNPGRRLAEHSKGSDWFERVARIDVEWHGSREDALRAEAVAASAEAPLFNSNKTGATVEALRAEDRKVLEDLWHSAIFKTSSVLDFCRNRHGIDADAKHLRSVFGPRARDDRLQWETAQKFREFM